MATHAGSSNRRCQTVAVLPNAAFLLVLYDQSTKQSTSEKATTAPVRAQRARRGGVTAIGALYD